MGYPIPSPTPNLVAGSSHLPIVSIGLVTVVHSSITLALKAEP